MPDTIYTPDGKAHVLIGSTTLEEVIRSYAGDEAADRVHEALVRNAYEEAIACSDLEAYEEEVSTLQRYISDWADDLRSIAQSAESRKITKHAMASAIRGVIKNMDM